MLKLLAKLVNPKINKVGASTSNEGKVVYNFDLRTLTVPPANKHLDIINKHEKEYRKLLSSFNN